MEFEEMNVDDRVAYLTELIECFGPCYLWKYDPKGNILKTTCPDRVLHRVFEESGLSEYLFEYIKDHHDPIVMSNPYGLLWCASFETDAENHVRTVYLFGPVGTQELTHENKAMMVNSSRLPDSWRPKFKKIINRMPIMMSSFFFQYAIMMNYCVSGKRINVADLVFFKSPFADKRQLFEQTGQADKHDRIHTYMAEQELLRMVREGNLHYKKALENAAAVSLGVGSGEKDALKHAQISQLVFISLCTRAAIEGGLSPETAYSKGDAYIGDIMNCKNVTDTVHIGHSMYVDFIEMVHQRNNNPLYSSTVQSCCDYIETHLEKKIELKDLARRLGYSEYYLSRKFKSETGKSISEYIRKARIERAMILLATTQMDIQNISDRLCFGSRSFFADTFRKEVGMPPAEYRRKNQKL